MPCRSALRFDRVGSHALRIGMYLATELPDVGCGHLASSSPPKQSAVITYAQNFEDVILARVFSGCTDGFYVDVGAGDPLNLSVTKWFYDLGWDGINIEPNRALFKRLVEARS